MNESWIAVTAIGRDRPGIVARVTGALLDLGCNLGETTMTRLRAEFAMIMLVRLPDGDSVAQARERLQSLGEEMDLTVTARELAADELGVGEGSEVSYILRVYGADRPGIVHAVTELLAREQLNITDLETRVIPGEGGPVYVMVMELDAPPAADRPAIETLLRELVTRMRIEISFDRLDAESL